MPIRVLCARHPRVDVDAASIGVRAFRRRRLALWVHVAEHPREGLRGRAEDAGADHLDEATDLQVALVIVVRNECVHNLGARSDDPASNAATCVVVNDHGVAHNIGGLKPCCHLSCLVPGLCAIRHRIADIRPRIHLVGRLVPIVAQGIVAATHSLMNVDAARVRELLGSALPAFRIHAVQVPHQRLAGRLRHAPRRDLDPHTSDMQVAGVGVIWCEGHHSQVTWSDDSTSDSSPDAVVDDHGVAEHLEIREAGDDLHILRGGHILLTMFLRLVSDREPWICLDQSRVPIVAAGILVATLALVDVNAARVLRRVGLGALRVHAGELPTQHLLSTFEQTQALDRDCALSLQVACAYNILCEGGDDLQSHRLGRGIGVGRRVVLADLYLLQERGLIVSRLALGSSASLRHCRGHSAEACQVQSDFDGCLHVVRSAASSGITENSLQMPERGA
mmetsp:Transcript_21103/g.58999  ORF Transcript_21103/g.58999 Transcript_21103/m.58999 type:complete len:450 (+) Transcript_21103:316-1665(+)